MQIGLNSGVRKKSRVAVLDINIDRFKRINESLGSAAGDQVLQEVARRILKCVRASDLAGIDEAALKSGLSARASGDGFSVFLTEVARAEDAALIAQRVIDAIACPMQCGDHELTLTACVGIAVHPDNGGDISTLLKNAETARRNAKKYTAGSFCFFTAAMNAQSLAILEVENDLRSALERDELVLIYQARVDVLTGRLAGAEALIRWQHPRRGLMPPAEFIPMAEQSGLIVPLTAWVVRAACRQLRQWQNAGLTVVPLSINLSAQSFREDGLCELIAASLREFNIAPSLLEGEITESVLMQDVEHAVAQLQQMRRMGIELAMDDFGTGYSSLAYLKRFPLNVLKVDRAFVGDVLTNMHDRAIASAIVTLGRTMGLAVVAEGMERVEQANYFISQGCHLMQGFVFARPVPAEVFAGLLRDGLEMPAGLRVVETPAPALASLRAGP
jgi:diguanylate cyclase (GGDEF)-like protein